MNVVCSGKQLIMTHSSDSISIILSYMEKQQQRDLPKQLF
jgi:hypothetical protein